MVKLFNWPEPVKLNILERCPPDLVFCFKYPQENRWRSNDEVINSGSFASPEQLPRNVLPLKRVKIVLDSEPTLSLLHRLSGENGPAGLLELEINTIQLPGDNFTVTFGFIALEVLSIDVKPQVVVVERRLRNTEIRFDTPSLQKVYLGQHSLRYVSFTNPQTIHFLSVSPPPDMEIDECSRLLHRFESLTYLEFNEVELFEEHVLIPFIIGEVGELTELHYNLDTFKSTDEFPEEEELGFLNHFYSCLTEVTEVHSDESGDSGLPNQILSGLRIYFNGVRLDLERLQFNDYGFRDPDDHSARTLISFHRHNEVANRLEVAPCRSVSQTNYLNVYESLEPRPVRDRFRRFAELYPNVRHVTIQQEEEEENIRSDELLDFFANCRGLLSLKFENAKLETEFYHALAQKDCCQSLGSLVICESTQFSHCIDFEFLNRFQLLTFFATNAAPKEMMFNCLTWMRSQQFIFVFNQGRSFRRFIFARNPITRHWAVRAEDATEQNFVKATQMPQLGTEDNLMSWRIWVPQLSLSHTYTSKAQLLNYFNLAQNRTPHWIPVNQALVLNNQLI